MANDILTATHTAMQEAIVFCAEKANLNGKKQVLEARQSGDCATCEYLRYGLAKNIAAYLGSMDNRAKASYIYDDPDAALTWHDGVASRPNNSPGIRMIVWVSRKSPALDSLLDTLTTAVEKELRQLPCPNANALCHTLDVLVVDDEEVERRTGYGSLINSVHLRPIEVWHR
jgi:hypothetical protein